MSEITEKMTIGELIEMGKAEYVTIRQKAKRIEELKSQIKILTNEKDRLESGRVNVSQWKKDFNKLVHGKIAEYMSDIEAKESEVYNG